MLRWDNGLWCWNCSLLAAPALPPGQHFTVLPWEEKGLMENPSSPIASAGPRETDFV